MNFNKHAWLNNYDFWKLKQILIIDLIVRFNNKAS